MKIDILSQKNQEALYIIEQIVNNFPMNSPETQDLITDLYNQSDCKEEFTQMVRQLTAPLTQEELLKTEYFESDQVECIEKICEELDIVYGDLFIGKTFRNTVMDRILNAFAPSQAEVTQTIDNHEKWLKNPADGCRANFSSRNLKGMDFSNRDLRNAVFKGAILTGATFDSCNLSDANFEDAQCNFASFKRSSLRNANLSGANMQHSSLAVAILCKSYCRYADFRFAQMECASLSGADCSFAVFEDSQCKDAVFAEADLSDANCESIFAYRASFARARCVRTSFIDAKLQSARFAATDCTSANFMKAEMNNACFEGAVLVNVNFDRSSFPLWCGTLDAITDEDLCSQLAYHLARLMKNSNLDPDVSVKVLANKAKQIERYKLPIID